MARIPTKRTSEMENVSELLGPEEVPVTQGGASKAASIDQIAAFVEATRGSPSGTIASSSTAPPDES